MQKITGFKIVSIIYFVISLLYALFLFLGAKVIFYMPVSGRFIYLIVFIIAAILYLVALNKISSRNKEGKLSKSNFIFPIVLGLISMGVLGLPYIIVSAMTMNKIQEGTTSNEGTINGSNSEDTIISNESDNNGLDSHPNLDTVTFNAECVGNNIVTKKTSKTTFWIVTIIYALTLILSIISLFDVNVLWDIEEMNRVTAAWLIAFSASYGLYLFLLSPFDFSKKVMIIGSISSIALMLVIDIFPIILLQKYKEILSLTEEGSMFGWFSSYTLLLVSMIVSEVGIIALNLLSLARFNPEKLKNRDYADNDNKEDDRFLVLVLEFLKTLVIAVFNSSLALMRLKEKHINIYSVFIVILCSYLCCVLSEILLILLVIFVIGLFIMIVSSMYIPTKHNVYEVSDGGYTRTLIYDGYETDGYDRYKDDIGHYWYTKDNGYTFFKEK